MKFLSNNLLQAQRKKAFKGGKSSERGSGANDFEAIDENEEGASAQYVFPWYMVV